MSVSSDATFSSRLVLSTITMSTSDDGIIRPVRDDPYSYARTNAPLRTSICACANSLWMMRVSSFTTTRYPRRRQLLRLWHYSVNSSRSEPSFSINAGFSRSDSEMPLKVWSRLGTGR